MWCLKGPLSNPEGISVPAKQDYPSWHFCARCFHVLPTFISYLGGLVYTILLSRVALARYWQKRFLVQTDRATESTGTLLFTSEFLKPLRTMFSFLFPYEKTGPNSCGVLQQSVYNYAIGKDCLGRKESTQQTIPDWLPHLSSNHQYLHQGLAASFMTLLLFSLWSYSDCSLSGPLGICVTVHLFLICRLLETD